MITSLWCQKDVVLTSQWRYFCIVCPLGLVVLIVVTQYTRCVMILVSMIVAEWMAPNTFQELGTITSAINCASNHRGPAAVNMSGPKKSLEFSLNWSVNSIWPEQAHVSVIWYSENNFIAKVIDTNNRAYIVRCMILPFLDWYGYSHFLPDIGGVKPERIAADLICEHRRWPRQLHRQRPLCGVPKQQL